jgi:hypothetical protein
LATSVRSFVRASKDVALGMAVRTAFNTRFRKIGEMTELSLDTKKRAVRLRLELRGEAQPIDVVIKKYRVQRRADRLLLTVDDVRASREWISAVLREVLVGRRMVIPGKFGAILNVLA